MLSELRWHTAVTSPKESSGDDMDSPAAYASLKALAAVVLLLMLVAMLYAAYMAVAHWTGIGV